MMQSDIISNVKSGFFISLIAMPLCLAISIASACPPIAGVITAIIGGVIVSFFGGCKLSIKGPAAGLIVIILATVNELGAGDLHLGYKRMLAVSFAAAIIQILLALLKTARFGRLIPPSVIHGMLAAIGIIILAKQIHILVGASPHGKTPFELIAEIPFSIKNINPELAFIGFFTLVLLLLSPLIPNKFINTLPSALLALLVVVPLSLYWHLDNAHEYIFLTHRFSVGPEYLVSIPDRFLSSLVFPDFSILLDIKSYKFILMLTLIGSIESVLTVIAVDDISKAKSSLNGDLLAIGIGNLITSLIGGLPMISEVVRSKANIDAKATSSLSNFIHGFFLLLFVSLLSPLIKEIPLAALAAMLMVTGYRLASPRQFLHAKKIGSDQLLLFLSTLITTLLTDLLLGVLIGCGLKIVLHLLRGVKLQQLFTFNHFLDTKDGTPHLVLTGPAIFTNYLYLQNALLLAHRNFTNVVLDCSKTILIDHTTLSCLLSLQEELGRDKITITGLEKLIPVSNHHLSTHRINSFSS